MKKCSMSLILTLVLGMSAACFALAGKNTPSWTDIYTKKTRIARGWKYIVIHHSATDAGSAKAFHKYHSDRGYGGLCYHFVIGNGNGSPDGKIEEGFRWKEQMAGTHVDVNSWYHNIFGIGICLVGNFEKSSPTEEQMRALTRLVKSLCLDYGIPEKNIIGHQDVPFGDIKWNTKRIHVTFKGKQTAKTSCPGRHFPDIGELFATHHPPI